MKNNFATIRRGWSYYEMLNGSILNYLIFISETDENYADAAFGL